MRSQEARGGRGADADRGDRARRLTAMPGWLARAVIAGVAMALLLAYLRAVTPPPVDFGSYYGAALALRDGRSPYEDALAWRGAGYVTGSPGLPPTAEP